MDLKEIISASLLQHPCVIIPGMGGFICQRNAAIVSLEKGKLFPPSKTILFNTQLSNDDGLLINAFAHAHHMGYSEAQRTIQIILADWKRDLIEGKRIEIGENGFLFQDQSGKVTFEQNHTYNSLLDSFGLPILSLNQNIKEQPVETKVEENIENQVPEQENVLIIDFEPKVETRKSNDGKVKQKPVVVNLPPIEEKIEKVANYSWLRYATAILLLPVVFYSFWIPMKTDFLESHMISLDDFNIFANQQPIDFTSTIVQPISHPKIVKKDIQKLIQNKNIEHTFSYEVDANTYKSIVVQPAKNDVEKIDKLEAKQPKSEISTVIKEVRTTSHQYYLIGNCFQSEENAENFVQQMKAKQIQAEIVDQKNGLYRVALGSANNLDDLTTIKGNLNNKGINNFWILKK